MLEHEQVLELAKAKKAVQAKRKKAEADEQQKIETLESAIRNLSDMLSRGIQFEQADSVELLASKVTEFGSGVGTLLSEIQKSVKYLHELDIPEKIELKTVTDKKLQDAR